MNYQKIHDQIIERARNRQLEGYKERHHIIPRCMGGTDDEDNLIDLTAREHFIIHLLLCEIYPDNQKLFTASFLMSTSRNGIKVSSRIYEYLKRNLKHTEETKEKIRQSAIGRKFSKETRHKLSEAGKGNIPWNKGKTNVYSADTLQKISNKLTGRYVSTEIKQKRSNTWKTKPYITCPHCNKSSINESNMRRWHFDNCKYK